MPGSRSTPDAGNLLCDEAVRDPHSYFAAIRERSPVAWSEHHRSWVISGHAEVLEALRSDDLSSDRLSPFTETRVRDETLTETLRVLEDWMVFKDPPVHTRMRRLVRRAFTPAAIRVRGDDIARVVEELMVDLRGGDRVDIIGEFAFPLPAIAIAEMMGVPKDDRDLFKEWSDQLSSFIFGAHDRPERYDEAVVGVSQLSEYLLALIEDHEPNAEGDLISMLLEQEDGDALTRHELISTCILLLFGGHETTTSLISSGLLALIQNPDQMRLIREDRSLVLSAVEELIRFDGPARATARIVARQHQVNDQTLEPGERVLLLNLAANRDPLVFEDPDRLDVRRDTRSHLGFGFGPHYCLGAHLARLEVQVAFNALLDRFQHIELACDPSELEWHPTMLSRSLLKLPLGLA